MLCTLRGRLKEALYEESDDGARHRRFADPAAVGDRVRISVLAEEGVVEELLPRKTTLSRIMAKAHDDQPDVEQIIAANLDQVVVLAAVRRPRLNLRFIDRLLLLAGFGGADALICINKSDLLRDKGRAELEELLTRVYRPLGAPWIIVSGLHGDGVPELRDALSGKFSVFVGSSGTGKSTVLNALDPSLALRTGDVSQASRKGRHTTAHVQMFDLDADTHVADTPGMREAGLWGVPTESIDYYFVEMRPYLGQCQFGDCWHFDEPDCAVRTAVDEGAISPERYASYRKLCQEVPQDDYTTPKYKRER